VSPTVALVGGATTLVLASVTLWSGLDTTKAHDAYVAAPTKEGWDNGRSKQLRTNILIGATAAAGVTTALIAIFWTKWHDEETLPPPGAPRVGVVPSDGGLSVSFGGRF
jgi:hypothetical protein